MELELGVLACQDRRDDSFNRNEIARKWHCESCCLSLRLPAMGSLLPISSAMLLASFLRKGCPWERWTCDHAASKGHLEFLELCSRRSLSCVEVGERMGVIGESLCGHYWAILRC